MGTYGGYSPQPERYGGGRRRLEFILDALVAADLGEVGLDSTPGTISWIECLALARMLDAAWGTNVRGSNEFDMRRVQSMLSRWEKRSEEHTSELQSHSDLVCRLLLEKKKNNRR